MVQANGLTLVFLYDGVIMKLTRRIIRYMFPSAEPKVKRDIDQQSLRSIHVISLILLFFETISLILFLIHNAGRFEHNDYIRLISVGYCIFLCAFAVILSQRMSRRKGLPHSRFFAFKIVFFVLFTVWAIFVDYQHYKNGSQMLTFYTVNLVLACFIVFRPWIGAFLIGSAYIGFFGALYSIDHAAQIQPLNFAILAVASIACNTVRCHGQIDASSKTIRLQESNAALETASRRDGLTGLLNRLALEEDAGEMDGRRMTVYMVDINYFKEINDQYGHAAGDAILQETGETLKQLFPGGHYYRYGGDEFLVLTYKPPEDNYGSDTYDFVQKTYGAKVLLSIGNAQASPASYQELFDLISKADDALYITKQRTHSVEFGGHDRRKNRP